jgi:hypothetical protein
MIYFSMANTRFKFLEHLHSLDEDVSIISVNSITQGTTLQQIIYDPTCEMIINDYSKTLELDSIFTYAWFNRANAKIFMGDYSGALNDFSKSLLCDSTFSDAYYNRGLVQIFLQDITNGCVDLSKAGELGVLESYNVMKRYCYK